MHKNAAKDFTKHDTYIYTLNQFNVYENEIYYMRLYLI